MSYALLILAWAVPVIALEWAFGWRTLAIEWRPLLATVAMATLYLGFADIVGTRRDLWSVDPRKTVGFAFGGFVFEDWLLLLLTDVMIAQTVILAIDHDLLGILRRLTRRT